MKYIVIAGNPWKNSFIGLRVAGVSEDKKKAEKKVREVYEESGGLVLLIDSDGNVV